MTGASGVAVAGVAAVAGVGERLGDQVLNGSLLVSPPVAALAGLVSFASPCVLPLVPGYLGYVTGLSGVDLERQRRSRVLAGASLFVLGFAVVFVVIGFTAGLVGEVLIRWQDPITRVMGLVVIAMGLVFLGAFPALQRERRASFRPAAGLAGAPLLGVVFGLGWTPCIGPVFAAVVALSLNGGDPARAAVLAVAYALGLGVPFLVVAAGISAGVRSLGWLRRHRLAVARAGGGMLVGVGLLLVTGAWTAVVSDLQGPISGYLTVI